jgi:hypothetical protein
VLKKNQKIKIIPKKFQVIKLNPSYFSKDFKKLNFSAFVTLASVSRQLPTNISELAHTSLLHRKLFLLKPWNLKKVYKLVL